jgi:hypothetical protein
LPSPGRARTIFARVYLAPGEYTGGSAAASDFRAGAPCVFTGG